MFPFRALGLGPSKVRTYKQRAHAPSSTRLPHRRIVRLSTPKTTATRATSLANACPPRIGSYRRRISPATPLWQTRTDAHPCHRPFRARRLALLLYRVLQPRAPTCPSLTPSLPCIRVGLHKAEFYSPLFSRTFRTRVAQCLGQSRLGQNGVPRTAVPTGPGLIDAYHRTCAI